MHFLPSCFLFSGLLAPHQFSIQTHSPVGGLVQLSEKNGKGKERGRFYLFDEGLVFISIKIVITIITIIMTITTTVIITINSYKQSIHASVQSNIYAIK